MYMTNLSLYDHAQISASRRKEREAAEAQQALERQRLALIDDAWRQLYEPLEIVRAKSMCEEYVRLRRKGYYLWDDGSDDTSPYCMFPAFEGVTHTFDGGWHTRSRG